MVIFSTLRLHPAFTYGVLTFFRTFRNFGRRRDPDPRQVAVHKNEQNVE